MAVDEKLYTAADLEAAKVEARKAGAEETTANIEKHLGWINKAKTETIMKNIKEGNSFSDCVEAYSDERHSADLSAQRQEDMQPENIVTGDKVLDLENKEGKTSWVDEATNLGYGNNK